MWIWIFEGQRSKVKGQGQQFNFSLLNFFNSILNLMIKGHSLYRHLHHNYPQSTRCLLFFPPPPVSQGKVYCSCGVCFYNSRPQFVFYHRVSYTPRRTKPPSWKRTDNSSFSLNTPNLWTVSMSELYLGADRDLGMKFYINNGNTKYSRVTWRFLWPWPNFKFVTQLWTFKHVSPNLDFGLSVQNEIAFPRSPRLQKESHLHLIVSPRMSGDTMV